jgi:hypothetical protein
MRFCIDHGGAENGPPVGGGAGPVGGFKTKIKENMNDSDEEE